MLYLAIILTIVVLLGLFLVFKKKQDSRKRIDEIVSKWGHPVEGQRDFKLISTYHRYCNHEEIQTLSDAVAMDIDLENLFIYVDRTNSKPGQQYLYQKLRSAKKELKELRELDQLAEYFGDHPEQRLSAELQLSRLSGKNAYYIHELFTTSYSSLYNGLIALYIRFAWLIWILSLVSTIVLKNQFFFLLTLGLTFFNFYLHYTNKKKIASYVHSLPQLFLLMNAAKNLLKLAETPEHVQVENSLLSLAPLQRSLSLVNFDNAASRDPSDLISGIMELIKTLLVIEPAMFLASINRINQHRSSIEVVFNYVAQTDIAISIHSLRTSLPYYCKPDFVSEAQKMTVTGLYHPLIENCVPNSIQVSSVQGVLITGSNMSGKTTFIRSVAINALLSQTLFTSCSKSYEAPFLQIFTSIRMSDDLEEHKSYFQSEALSILNIIKRSASGNSSLIMIDEIFRGTNTVERVAAAKAILSYLTAHENFTFVSTHDLELAELLGTEYAIYSFEEMVSDTRLMFDYKIKPGILKNKNGIAILSALGYPESIVEDATVISTALREKYSL